MSTSMYLDGKITNLRATSSGSIAFSVERESFYREAMMERTGDITIMMNDPRRATLFAQAWAAVEAKLTAEKAEAEATKASVNAAEADVRSYANGVSVAEIEATLVEIKDDSNPF